MSKIESFVQLTLAAIVAIIFTTFAIISVHISLAIVSTIVVLMALSVAFFSYVDLVE